MAALGTRGRGRRSISISTAFLVAVAAIAGFTVAVVGYLWLTSEYRRFASESQELRRVFIDEQKAKTREEVAKVLDYIGYRHSRAEAVLRTSLRNRVYEAEAIALHLYEIERGRRTGPELERLVVEALRPIRFNNGRGYYFMVSMQGIEKLYPVAPQFENQNLLSLRDAKGNYVIRDEIKLLQEQTEGFVFDSWRKPAASTDMIYPKITFVKRFEPFGWYIGTGEYLDDHERDLQDELLDRIARVRFGREGYVFVNTYDGDALIKDGIRVTTPTNLWALTDPDGVKVIQEERRACELPDGGFIRYSWDKLTEASPAPKLSFVKGYPKWRWMIGAGVYVDEIEQVIAARRAGLGRAVQARIMSIAAVLLGLGAIVALVANAFSRRTRRSFEAFSEFFADAATQSSTIDETQFPFSEFASLARSANTMIDARRRTEEEKRELQEQLLRSRQMEALGLLAGGVSHDLNNILSGLVMYPDLLLLELPPDSPARKRVAAIKESGQRAAAVVADLLAASRGGRAEAEIVDLNVAVEEFLRSPEHQHLCDAHPGASVRRVLDPDALNVRCSRSQLAKTLMNLVANAMEAMKEPGVVTISTANRVLAHPYVGYERIPAGEYVVLRVDDTGVGISEADLARIFEPFFTKRLLGRKGTGLGLTVVWHTVRGSSGFVDVHSSPGGSSFELYFPARREAPAALPPALPVETLSGHGERILVVDDEPTQRDIASELLTRLGYRVTVAATGEEAIALAAREPFDLVVLDMLMPPGIGGRETCAAILRERPEQKVVIASGYAETADIRATLEMGAGEAVLKPYTVETFGRAVRDELRRPVRSRE